MTPETLDPKPRTLSDWLAYLERIHSQSIAMGLDRVERVRRALGIEPRCAVITVGGTNGKGSCCAMLEAMLLAAGYRVGCYTSPHLLRYNERVRIAGLALDDGSLCRAFERIEAARDGVLLTYFEFGTLAAMLAFEEAAVEVAILEVGLGGRLDAVNVFDADCALVAAVDIDHVDYLGASREAIGFEKAGIYRAGRPAICADRDPPRSLIAHAQDIGAQLLLIGRDFGFSAERGQWGYWGPNGKRHGLPHPLLRGEFQLANAAACITALEELHARIPVAAQDIRGGLLSCEIPARFQVLPGQPVVILDVAHNPQAARALAQNLSLMGGSGQTVAVFSMLKDKDIIGVASALKDQVTRWHVAPAQGARAASADELCAALAQAQVTAPIQRHGDVAGAWRAACDTVARDDRIIVFGSFLTVAAVMQERQSAGANRT